MKKGDFKKFSHEHFFQEKNGGTIMTDKVVLEAPYGVAVKIIVYLFLKKYIKNFLLSRNELIKEFAETGRWRSILTNEQK